MIVYRGGFKQNDHFKHNRGGRGGYRDNRHNFYNRGRGRGRGNFRRGKNYGFHGGDAVTQYDRFSQYSDQYDLHSTHSYKGRERYPGYDNTDTASQRK